MLIDFLAMPNSAFVLSTEHITTSADTYGIQEMVPAVLTFDDLTAVGYVNRERTKVKTVDNVLVVLVVLVVLHDVFPS